MPTIYIDNEVFGELQRRAVPLVDNSNSVLRREFGLDKKAAGKTEEPLLLEIPLKSDYAIRYGLIPVPKANRRMFPGFKKTFALETESGITEAKVTSGANGTPEGDLDAGDYITGNLRELYRKAKVKPGDTLRIEVVQPGTRYRLTILAK